MKTQEKALNAFCGINGYEPVTIEELVENNKVFKEKADITPARTGCGMSYKEKIKVIKR